MVLKDIDKEIAVASSSGKERGASTADKSPRIEDIDTEDDDQTSLSSGSTDSIHPVADARPSINRTWSLNTGHSWLGNKELAAITTVTTNATHDPRFEIDFDDDGENPQDWSMVKKSLIIFFMSYSTLVVVMYSTSYTSGIPGMMRTFGIESRTLIVLGITTYLTGIALGSLLLAPLSEMYGRRPVYLIAIFAFTVLVIPCALSNNLPQILVTRFFGAIAGSAMIANAPGTVSDIVNEHYRALAFSIWSIGPMNGPVVGPLVGGFVYEYMGWRWTNWVVMIGAGTAWLMIFFIKETYAPALLRAKATKKRKETNDPRWHCRYDDKKEFWPLLRENLYRPLYMSVKEPICIFWNVYIALIYSVLYLCFVSYPIVFGELRGWSPGFIGLGYMGIGIGGMTTILSEPLIRRMINAHKKDPETGKPYPEAMVSVVCIAALLVPIGELIFAWTGASLNVHWIVPLIAGIPFGAGNCGVFIYASNYLVHSYGIYAASALAGNTVLRSIMGGALPLAGPKMYASLGPRWSATMLALIEFAMIPIPVVFYLYGHKIRQESDLIRHMREDREKLEGRKKRAAERVDKSKGTEGRSPHVHEKKALEV
ncbi:MFS general substrate transporter [Cucurbitaria berberidis CBS 394.84]|uniref:MFS general substrate transporter n=1 Tax=Cucurbitaria berberidis CBS 394.84 TaxID=1168544 RepID=A0A9P4LAY8_9PLEO|nr:MFS general substrate transporter [Cucurbitaria berberidis CBS 394.84]KAF1848961.1 MFS general substrate transporter [Cucurbitaria berberidis CBS 394.84]